MAADYPAFRPPRVLSVNVGRPRSVEAGRRAVSTAIWKAPVEGRVAARGVNLDGDDQADRTVHGGPDKAVYASAIEEGPPGAATPALAAGVDDHEDRLAPNRRERLPLGRIGDLVPVGVVHHDRLPAAHGDG